MATSEPDAGPPTERIPAVDVPVAAGAVAPGCVLAGRYRLDRVLANGGMASVWVGTDQVLTRPVAVKVANPHLASDPSFRERFRREAQSAARLTSPAIVATFDAGVDGDVAYMVMELVEGRTLAQRMAEGPLPLALAVDVAAKVADALEVAHRAGVVHRDVKPGNLLLVEEPGGVRVKVADFGVARAQEAVEEPGAPEPLTREGQVIGTARYLSPEQVRGGAVDARADLYSLGVVLHEMLAGQAPFVRDTDLATAVSHLQDQPPRLGPPVPAPLADLVLQLLAKDPDARPPSAAAVAARLRAVPLGEGRDARPAFAPPPPAAGGAAPTVALEPAAARPLLRSARAARAARAGRRPERGPGGTQTVRRPRRSRGPLAVVGLVVLAAVATGLSVLGAASRPGGEGPRRSPVASSTTAGGPVEISRAVAFDPQGDRRENDSQLARLLDGRASTAWSTERYETREPFGGLKEGVGVYLLLSREALVRVLDVDTTTQGWSAQVYVARAPAAALAGWGRPAAEVRTVDGSTRIDLGEARGRAVLLWFTDLGTANQARVQELRVRVA